MLKVSNRLLPSGSLITHEEEFIRDRLLLEFLAFMRNGSSFDLLLMRLLVSENN